MDERIRHDLQERLEGKPLSEAAILTPVIKVKDSETAKGFSKLGLPGYFCGNRKADTVVVNLNPGIGVDKADKEWDTKTRPFDHSSTDAFIADYKTYCENYGEIDKDNFDTFDVKTAAFFYEWDNNGIHLPCLPEDGWDDRPFCLDAKKLVLLNKLQLELVPYASAKFEIDKKNIKLFLPYVDMLLDEIFAMQRTYVVFAGNVFDDIFIAYNEEHRNKTFEGVEGPSRRPRNPFKKKDGTDMKTMLRCKVITMNYNGRRQKALIAHSFPQKSLANAFGIYQQYGEFCHGEYIK